MAILSIISAIATGFSVFSGAKSAAARKRAGKQAAKREAQLGKLAAEEVEYQPITQEEIDATTQYLNAQAEEYAADTRVNMANKAAAAGYDPREILGQLEPEIQKTREEFVNNTIAQLKLEDLRKQRDFRMNESLRVLQNRMQLLSQPSAEEVQSGVAAQKWANIASLGTDFAGFLGRQFGKAPAKAPVPMEKEQIEPVTAGVPPAMGEAVGPLTAAGEPQYSPQQIQYWEQRYGKS